MQALEIQINKSVNAIHSHKTLPQGLKNLEHSGGTSVNRKTYKSPVPKVAVMSIFLLSGTRSFQTEGIGSISKAKSEMTLKIAVASYWAPKLKQ